MRIMCPVCKGYKSHGFLLCESGVVTGSWKREYPDKLQKCCNPMGYGVHKNWRRNGCLTPSSSLFHLGIRIVGNIPMWVLYHIKQLYMTMTQNTSWQKKILFSCVIFGYFSRTTSSKHVAMFKFSYMF